MDKLIKMKNHRSEIVVGEKYRIIRKIGKCNKQQEKTNIV